MFNITSPLIINYSCLPPFNTLKICNTAGKRASIDSLAPLVDPGRAITKVLPIVPATLRESIA